jgi:hypothetical protein
VKGEAGQQPWRGENAAHVFVERVQSVGYHSCNIADLMLIPISNHFKDRQHDRLIVRNTQLKFLSRWM